MRFSFDSSASSSEEEAEVEVEGGERGALEGERREMAKKVTAPVSAASARDVHELLEAGAGPSEIVVAMDL